MCTKFVTDRRGVSSTLGYAFTFSIIILTVLFLLATGFGGLSDARDSAEANNAVKAFDIMSNNIEELYLWDAPSRSTEIQLSGGSVGIRPTETDQTRIDTEIYDPNTDTRSSYSTISYPVVYETTADTSVIYDAGMIMRVDGSNAALVDSPPLSFTPSRSTLTIVKNRGSAQTGGDSTTLFIAKNRGDSIEMRNATQTSESPLSVEMTIEAPPERLPAWKSYFESEGLTAVDDTVSDGTIVYEYETDRALVRSVTIGFELDRAN